MPRFFLNDRAGRLSDALLADFAGLGVAEHSVAGAQVIDAGINAPGGLAAGLAAARLGLADLGEVAVIDGPAVSARTDHPVAACLASQYAGWQVKLGSWFGMCSGPLRAHYGKEEIFDEVGHRESAERVVGVLEGAKFPTPEIIEYLAARLQIPTSAITLWIAPTASLAGCVQVVARSVEVAMHKLHTLKYDLTRVRAGFGSAPLPNPGSDDLVALGRTNDAILYGSRVQLWVHDSEDRLAAIGPLIPASASPAFGTPFLELLKAANFDFYAMDPALFAPAIVTLHNLESGRSHTFGRTDDSLIRRCTGQLP
ncbi:MAG: methenyltetrahydromethanopterin cyclohydrolase [Gemmataceae bacterium]|nr:methenyltetrahydromethanopterin cyclohydrolase [Gemmataceae bacterium]